jgi:hypothetical protein
MTEYHVPDLSPVTTPIYSMIREWFPRAKAEDCEELAFAIAYDALHVVHVEGPLWSVTLDQPSAVPHLRSRYERLE